MIRKIDHIGVAVRSLDERLPFWKETLGLRLEGLEEVASEGVQIAFLPAGATRIELLEPLAEDSPVGRFLAKRGEGVHHVTLQVDELDPLLERLRERGVRVLGDGPRPGAGGSRVAFLHPGSTGGVLLELVEREAESGAADVAPGRAVLVYLREPQEKLWGVLRRMDAAGIVIEGIDLGSFDDWVAQLERGDESIVGASVLFLPMNRIERILLDRSSGQLPSLAERFHERVGRTVTQVLGGPEG